MKKPVIVNPEKKIYREFLALYADHYQYAVTLTLKQSIPLYSPEGYQFIKSIDEECLQRDLKYFRLRLTRFLYGNRTKHEPDIAIPLMIVAIESGNGLKNQHIHIGLGNVPEGKHSQIESVIKNAWSVCDFAYHEMQITPIDNAQGWNKYITKEISRKNTDVVDIVSCSIPKNLIL